MKVRSFLRQAATLNGYIARLRSSYYSRDATEATKNVVPHNNTEFTTIMLHAMPKMWKQQYHLGHKAPPNVEYLQDALEKIEVAFPVDGSVALKPPIKVKELRRFLGMVQYYRDLWAAAKCLPHSPIL